jgi:two-component SAPR family response regulator
VAQVRLLLKEQSSIMSLDDIKIFALNGTTFAISVSNAETMLKIVLLTVSIGYTAHKWYVNIVNKK